MAELVRGIPADVVEFVAECRKKSYALDAVPTNKSESPFQTTFRFHHDGMRYQDVCYEQDGTFSGTESVTIYRSANLTLVGRAFYTLLYAGSNLPAAQNYDPEGIMFVQHMMVINNPGVVRFGATDVRVEMEKDSTRYLYLERGKSIQGVRKGKETLGVFDPKKGYSVPVYNGSTLFTNYSIS